MGDDTATYPHTREGRLENALKDSISLLSGHICASCGEPITENPVAGHCKNSKHFEIAEQIREWEKDFALLVR